jgi:hypothetical protein
MVVDEILGVVKLFPVDNKVPPVESEYHLMVPEPVADSVTVPVPHLEAFVTVGASCSAAVIDPDSFDDIVPLVFEEKMSSL